MIDDLWPDLSGWYPLPEGGTIPQGMRYAVLESNGFVAVSTASRDHALIDATLYSYRTERPVPAPLPTEEGARIIARGPWYGLLELALTDGRWQSPGGIRYDDDDITRWMPATEWRER